MDHKVSKDMISSGMIPSGERTQADLGRTQYGSAPSPSSLMDAYKSIYEHHQKDADGKVIEHDEKEELNEGKMPEGLKNYLMKKKGKKEDKKEMKEENIDEMLSGRERAQQMAKARIAAGKTISDVKSANTASMRSSARARNVDFRAKRRPDPKPMASNPQSMRQQGVGKSASDMSRHSTGYSGSAPKTSSNTSTSTSVRRRGGGVSTSVKSFQKPQPSGSNRRAMMSKRRQGLMNDVDLFDIIKGRLIDEFYLEEKEALNLMINLSESELNELALGTAGAIAGTAALAGMGINAIRKQMQNKKKMEQGGQFKKGSTMDNIQKKNQMLKNFTNN